MAIARGISPLLAGDTKQWLIFFSAAVPAAVRGRPDRRCEGEDALATAGKMPALQRQSRRS
jgi:hypothetical protein